MVADVAVQDSIGGWRIYDGTVEAAARQRRPAGAHQHQRHPNRWFQAPQFPGATGGAAAFSNRSDQATRKPNES
jgi:hypothetical protein